MEKGKKIHVNNEETLFKTQEEEEKREGNDGPPPEEFPDEFQCCVCLDLLYKPVVLACGHMSCFWCVYSAMNHFHESNCPICRCPFNHFPSVCQLLHFLLLKLYPIAYKKRERQVQEEEKTAGHFSPQFDKSLFEPQLRDTSDNLGNNRTLSHLQTDLHSESCSKDGESSSFKDSPKPTMHDEINLATSLSSSEHAANVPNQGSNSRNDSEHRDQKKASVTDLLCVACNKLLFRPVVLNCGHVYCESCFVIPKDEIAKCQVCQSLHPNGFPSVCLIVDHFLEEQFPEEYSERRATLLKENNCSTQAQRFANRATAISTDVYSSWFFGNGPKVHVGVGCDYCGMSPIIGERYKCKDCVEKIGFDLCESCYKAPVQIVGRFNQQHKPEHEFEIVPPLSISDFIFRMNSEQSDEEGSDAAEHMDDASQVTTLEVGVQPDQGDESQEPEDISPSLILSVDVSLDQEDDSDDPSDNNSSHLT
ncbi:Zinc finger, ZZ-type [Corchorus olitorius]|uniref:Zinc finger, ZZ-type n=1 Tax=Corchorus olitorius TaxID=93759 RepID=A0A1R3K9E7_9ROSI|nr:Zinc finger, ZZ-type [Corchorus olitorius]